MSDESAKSPEDRITYLGKPVLHQDGAEDELIRILRAVENRSDGSDELLGHITDWPSRHHLSPLRSNLVRPLRLEAGMRVLDVGCGSGSVLRYLGEQGLDVTGLEGRPSRARAAAIRCGDLPNVKVVCGPLEEFEGEPFDLVLAVGVLEHSHRLHSASHKGFLDAICGLLTERGVLGIAIENQIGLKYLIGYNEDHLGLPWVGVEGYRRREGVRTWSRRELNVLLDSAGLTQRRWLYPYPDHKLPTHVFTDSLYGRPEGPELVAKFLRNPVVDGSAEPALICDAAGAHSVMLAAGLGEEVANSFFILSSREPEALDQIMHPDDAWLFSQQRLKRWRRARSLRGDSKGYRLLPFGPVAKPEEQGWLRLEETAEEPVFPGKPLDMEVAEALARSDLERARELLGLWWKHLVNSAVAVDHGHGNPYLPPGATLTLPGNMIDANLDNFLMSGDQLIHVDTELVAHPAVDAVFVAARSLRYLAERAVLGGWIHPWIKGETVAEIHSTLCDWAGLQPERPGLDALAAAEAQLQEIVVGADPGEAVKVSSFLSQSPMFSADGMSVPFTTLVTNLQAVTAENARSAQSLQALTAELSLRVAEVEECHAALSQATARAEERLARIEQLEARTHDLAATVAAMESSRSWRVTKPLRLGRAKLMQIRNLRPRS